MFLIAINVLLATLNVYTNYTFINIQFKYVPINYYNHVFINVHEITAIIMQLLTQIHPRKNKVNIHRSKVLERIINFTLLLPHFAMCSHTGFSIQKSKQTNNYMSNRDRRHAECNELSAQSVKCWRVDMFAYMMAKPTLKALRLRSEHWH